MPIGTRAAIYARVSTDLQEKEHTIQSQLEAVRAYASERGYIISGEYIDDGFSGATLERVLDSTGFASPCGRKKWMWWSFTLLTALPERPCIKAWSWKRLRRPVSV